MESIRRLRRLHRKRISHKEAQKAQKEKLAEDESLVLNSFVPLVPFRGFLFLNL